jgi:hypothetical protein
MLEVMLWHCCNVGMCMPLLLVSSAGIGPAAALA